ncbi:uncharacterized protein [Mytilus edulis]|uniref:uncharacterized protein n=1 Tax=Mytilus edulis TaxID=6550 RepID=UPI0039EF203C
MDCFLCRSPKMIRIKKPNARVVKKGYLKIYERGCLYDGWNSRFFVLFEDSSLLWYENQNSYHHNGGIKLKMVANFMAVGPMCLHTSKLPKLPNGKQVVHLMGIPNIFKRGTRKENINMNWILFDGGDEDMKAWLEAIKVTLPPPPPRPARPYPPNNNVQPTAPTPPYNVTNYHPPNEAAPLIVHTHNTYGGGDSSLATGMLVGAAIGYGLGGFGPGMGWDWGWGWGPNPYSGYWGGWDEGGTVDIDYADYDFGDNMDYGYADSDIGEFEDGDFGGDDGGFYGGDGEGYTNDYGGGYNDSFTGADGGGYDGDYGGGDGSGFAGNEDGGYADNYAGGDDGGGDYGGDGGGCGGGCGGD